MGHRPDRHGSWVVEPSGETCFFSQALTTIGGQMSKDFTSGYGPEEYTVRRAMGGNYQIKANFYGSRAQDVTGPTTVQATVVTDYGRPAEQRRALTLRLTTARDVVDIGAVVAAEFEPPRREVGAWSVSSPAVFILAFSPAGPDDDGVLHDEPAADVLFRAEILQRLLLHGEPDFRALFRHVLALHRCLLL